MGRVPGNRFGVGPKAWAETERVCQLARRQSGSTTVSLAFSCGKDSIVSWLVLRQYFSRVIPIFWYLVPGLKFVDSALAYYEDWFQTPILRLPHPDRFDLFKTWSFQPPHRLTALEAIMAEVPDYTMDELVREVKGEFGLQGTLHSTGIRLADTPQRATLIKKHSGFSPSGEVFYPVAYWSSDDVEACLHLTDIKLPMEYQWYGRSFDGIMARWMAPIREYLPADYARILDDFPLADLEFLRRQWAGVDDPVTGLPMYKRVGRSKYR